MTDITSANCQLAITIPGVFNSPQVLVGFSADDIFDIDEVDAAEILMGVDGRLSGGFVFSPSVQRIRLQADSPSVNVFDQWYQYSKSVVGVVPASAVFKFPAIGLKFNISKGILQRYKSMPDARRILQPRTFTIAWENPIPSPIAGV
jgi:hypothetical protein